MWKFIKIPSANSVGIHFLPNAVHTFNNQWGTKNDMIGILKWNFTGKGWFYVTVDSAVNMVYLI